MNAFLKKLRISESTLLRILFPVPDFSLGDALDYASPNDLPSECDWLMVFLRSKAERDGCMAKVNEKMGENGIVWLAFPKKSSKIKTDLSRDNILEGLEEIGFQFLSLVALNTNWSAFGMRKTDPSKVVPARSKPLPFPEFIYYATREITLPDDLKAVFETEPEAFEAYEKLAFSHQKEYILWILEAKKEETRQNRIEKTISMLLNGRKNPSDKQ